jgi:hypothetical protein
MYASTTIVAPTPVWKHRVSEQACLVNSLLCTYTLINCVWMFLQLEVSTRPLLCITKLCPWKTFWTVQKLTSEVWRGHREEALVSMCKDMGRAMVTLLWLEKLTRREEFLIVWRMKIRTQGYVHTMYHFLIVRDTVLLFVFNVCYIHWVLQTHRDRLLHENTHAGEDHYDISKLVSRR